ncbi:hypothetical protein ACTXPC_17795 [Brachybacterium alimentarium]|uniref:hypothetical protein n=1 Tax=Brachybacterium alimentarium TaxID=47845 RepID=UPI003FCEEB7D
MGIADHPAVHNSRLFGMKVRRVSNTLGSRAKLAHWAGISHSRAARWSEGQMKSSVEAARMVIDLEFIIARASMVWDDEVIQDWLEGHNAFLGGAKPLDMVRRGRTSEVLGAISGDEAGVFA